MAIYDLVGEWVESLRDIDLSGTCKSEGQGFFDYLQGRGLYSGAIANIVIKATGINPAQLWKVEDGEQLRRAIMAY